MNQHVAIPADPRSDTRNATASASRRSISDELSAFATALTYDRIPPTVRERAKHLILDVRVAAPSSARAFIRPAYVRRSHRHSSAGG
jgi:2-methylcitrate dehydratase PrpD